MRRVAVVLCAIGSVLVVSGCHSSDNTASDGTPPVVAGSTAPTVVAPAPTQSTQSTQPAPTSPAASPPPTSAPAVAPATESGVATSLDPCQLVTSAEASALAGVSLGTGTEQASGNGKQCVYGSQTLNVFTVEVAQAASAAAAQAAWASEKAEVEANLKQKVPAGVTLNFNTDNVTGIGDQAATVDATATIEGKQIGISGIYVLKGATFFAFQDLVLGTPPPVSAMEAEAKTVLGRV